jgi:hypothetical protein
MNNMMPMCVDEVDERAGASPSWRAPDRAV